MTAQPENDPKVITVDFTKKIRMEGAPTFTSYAWKCVCCERSYVYDSREEETNKPHIVLKKDKKNKIVLCSDCCVDVALNAQEEGWLEKEEDTIA